MINRICVVVVLVYTCFSCSDIVKDAQKDQVEGLNKKVSQVDREFKKIQIDSISALKSSTYQVENRIKKNYYSDTVDIVFGKKMNDYKRMRKILGQLGKSGSQLRQSIKEEKEQLDKLLSDIEQGFGQRELYNDYIQFEKNKVGQIGILLEDYKNVKHEFMYIYNELHLELLNYSMTLNN